MIKSVIIAVICLIVFVLLFLALRNFFAWYHKRNEQIKIAKKQVENQSELIEQNYRIIAYLKVISEK